MLSFSKKVLYFLHALARRLRPWRLVFFVLIAVFALMSVYGLSSTEVYPASFLQIGLSGILWCLMVLATIELFQTLPEPVRAHHGFFRRIKLHFALAFYYMLALVIVLSTIILIGTSFRLLRM